MEYISLYRKYRPKNFDEVVGQNFIVKTLQNSIKLDRISHAYIFSGPKGIGKTSIAKIFSKAVNCLNSDDKGNHCNKCENCELIDKLATDILELDAASNNGVEEIRKIINNVSFLPIQLKYKIYIIDEAHMLTTSAWNALLKTIEEPPQHVMFIFATTEINKIPATILSRCQNFQFSKVNQKESKEILDKVIINENIIIDDNSINKIIELGNGSARDLLSILDQLCLYTNNKITPRDIDEVFGLIDINNKLELIKKIISLDLNEIIKEVNFFSERGINFLILVSDIIEILIDKIIFLQTNEINDLKILNLDNIDFISLSKDKLIALTNVWQKNYAQIKNSNDTKLVFLTGVFESMNLFNQPIQSENKIVEQKNLKEPLISFPKIKELEKQTKKPIFKFSEIKFDDNKNIPENTNQSKDSFKSDLNISLDEMFMRIGDNTSKELRDDAIVKINSIKESVDSPPCFNSIFSSKKVVVASKNGIVLLFDDEADAFLLNTIFKNKDFQQNIIKYFGQNMYVIGFDSKKIKTLISEYKKNTGNREDLPLDLLKKVCEDNSSLTFLAKKLFKNE